jgi:transcriptional regulator with XRE-family HTH domain
MTKPAQILEKTRQRIGRRVRELRKQREWTQADLAARLDLTQGRLSDIERGQASFTAEQFVTILKLFNAPLSDFGDAPSDHEAELQNALARLGADHIRENPSVLPSEHFSTVAEVIRETLLLGSPRLVTGLAPVLVRNIDVINLRHLYGRFAQVGLDRRLSWLVENTLLAIRERVATSPPRPWTKAYKRAEVVLEPFLDFLGAAHGSKLFDRPFDAPDVLDHEIRTKETLEAVTAAASGPSKRWQIATRLQVSDFLDALRLAAPDD